ncbi:class I adenylate-forming enzyme family protein [Rhodococcoides kyotonense]|uniref:Acyl-CoA synthetase (AMP-forming)/AMP-acid ligase II n=1 Tax=Rhodococcoides kyotonense TaxID=398843 RepID=A0A239MXQ1_9NOCA|nr:AMP-binding protein [Rhodococcus kyotonensis]SNT47577.1 Acyl-CoA synthetase (AMP-forming)/AMP-acid ligase II [Rhodococcus kyotonensis]
MVINVNDLVNRRADNRWDRTSVGDLLERVTWSTPDKTVIVGWEGAFAHPENERLTYRQANDKANQFANALLAQGLSRGDVVMMLCDNSVEAWLTKLAVAKAGLVVAPVNTMMAPDVVGQLADLVEPKFLVVDAERWAPNSDALGSRGVSAGVTITIGGGVVDGSASFADFIAGSPSTEPDVDVHGDDIWQILFTSGTTAAPKGVMLSHHATHYAGLNFTASLTRGLRHETAIVQCSFLPLIYHVGDHLFNISVLLNGGTLVLGRKPDPVAIAQAIDREKVTCLWGGSPAMLGAVAETLDAQQDLDASTLTVAVYGWAALPPRTFATLRTHCGDTFQALAIFGQTESIGCHRFWPDSWTELYERTAPQDNYVGVPSPILASQIFDPFGDPIVDSAGGPGEAVYRSPALFAGYYRNEQATADAFAGGWFHSGDSCVIGESGQRIMVDRYKDIVKTGGENVSTLRVEAVLLEHPAVARAAVVGLPHEQWGEAVTAVIVARDGIDADPSDIIEFARARLAGFETPKRVEFVDSLPDTVGGKILKYKLRQSLSHLYN